MQRDFDDALAAWLARQAAAEERLTSFAFREGQPEVDLPTPTSQDTLGRWLLAVVAEADTASFLAGLGADGRAVAELAGGGSFGLRSGDRVALAARIGVLTASGLVSRELESDRVCVTELGRAALALAVEVGVSP